MLRTFACAAFALLIAAPVQADTTAVYKSPKLGAEMTIEIASNGDVRGSVGGRGDYILTLDGKGYLVFFTDKGVVVDRVDDAATAMTDYIREKMPQLAKMPGIDGPGGPDGPKYVAGGVLTVNGRAGTTWYLQWGAAQRADSEPEIVISNDPALAELGRAMARQFEMSTRTLGQMLGHKDGRMSGMNDVLRTGAPLRVAGMDLVSVTAAPIAADRFKLPAEPETLEQVRARLVASGGHIP